MYIVGPGAVPGPGDVRGRWVIINYDILKKHVAALLEHDWAGVVFDEAHYVKNHRSQRSRVARQLVEREGQGPAIVALTGTPMTNRPRDLFALPRMIVNPGDSRFELLLKASGVYPLWSRLPRLGILGALRRTATGAGRPARSGR